MNNDQKKDSRQASGTSQPRMVAQQDNSCQGKINYLDTRGSINPTRAYSFTQAVIEGLAPGGGLFVPQSLPHLELDEICKLASMPYAEQAAFIYERFCIDLPAARIHELMEASYGANFDNEDICPIRTVAPGMHVLELWHGPTSAFKDMALQCLPQFFSASIEQLRLSGNNKEDFLILVATSGDTGKAALEGFAGRNHTSIVVFYPADGVSDMQRLQMVTQRGDNVRVCGVKGNFDDCQTSVKHAFNDETFSEQLASKYAIKLSSANSINWGRLLPQIVYYVSSYARMVASDSINKGDPIDVCVPTGNFGNILAAFYAREIGTPIERLICASNENRVLTDFINTGSYDISQRTFKLTPSPSMDILVSSNLERQLFELSGHNAQAIKGWMEDLRRDKSFRVDKETFAQMRALYCADWVSNNDCLSTIQEVFADTNYLLDPHTAVAWKVAERLRGTNPVLIASTAHWAKFGTSVYRAIEGIDADSALPPSVASLDGIRLNELIARKTGIANIPAGLAHLDELPVRFTQTIEADANSIEAAVRTFLEEK